MINDKRVLAVIPARGGSKGVPRKNIRELAGKPLIAWTIEEAKKSKYIDRIIASSEDEEIIKVAVKWGADVPFVRPLHLAQDDTPGIEPVLHAVQAVQGYDYIVLLQPTSPLRIVEDIDGCIEQCVRVKAPSCISVVESEKSPYWMYKIGENEVLAPLFPNEHSIPNRQQLPKVYSLNGAVYVASIPWLVENKDWIGGEGTVGYSMPQGRSLDIDSVDDFSICDMMLQRRGEK